MTIFVDASAMVAMMTNESDAYALEARFGAEDRRLCSALSLWETARAVAKKRSISVDEARGEVDRFVADFQMALIGIGDAEGRVAIDAHLRYGKGSTHRAQLNMGDCFANACARTNGAKLLYKGDDFAHTDLA